MQVYKNNSWVEWRQAGGRAYKGSVPVNSSSWQQKTENTGVHQNTKIRTPSTKVQIPPLDGRRRHSENSPVWLLNWINLLPKGRFGLNSIHFFNRKRHFRGGFWLFRSLVFGTDRLCSSRYRRRTSRVCFDSHRLNVMKSVLIIWAAELPSCRVVWCQWMWSDPWTRFHVNSLTVFWRNVWLLENAPWNVASGNTIKHTQWIPPPFFLSSAF